MGREHINGAQTKHQITINDEVASQLRPSRAINLRTVVCHDVALLLVPPFFLSRFRVRSSPYTRLNEKEFVIRQAAMKCSRIMFEGSGPDQLELRR